MQRIHHEHLAQRQLAADEGIFSEPAGAISVVCLVTGSGFKDAPSVERMLADRDAPLLEPAQVADYVK